MFCGSGKGLWCTWSTVTGHLIPEARAWVTLPAVSQTRSQERLHPWLPWPWCSPWGVGESAWREEYLGFPAKTLISLRRRDEFSLWLHSALTPGNSVSPPPHRHEIYSISPPVGGQHGGCFLKSWYLMFVLCGECSPVSFFEWDFSWSQFGIPEQRNFFKFPRKNTDTEMTFLMLKQSVDSAAAPAVRLPPAVNLVGNSSALEIYSFFSPQTDKITVSLWLLLPCQACINKWFWSCSRFPQRREEEEEEEAWVCAWNEWELEISCRAAVSHRTNTRLSGSKFYLWETGKRIWFPLRNYRCRSTMKWEFWCLVKLNWVPKGDLVTCRMSIFTANTRLLIWQNTWWGCQLRQRRTQSHSSSSEGRLVLTAPTLNP